MKRNDTLANMFYETFYKRKWAGEFEFPVSELSIAEAYEVQDRVTRMRINKGEKVAGFKIGCTSKAIRLQFSLDEPIAAKLFDPHIYNEGVELDWKDFGKCAIEPEMVLKIGKDLGGRSITDDQLIEAIEYVSPGIEIHNFNFWFPPPTLQELICSGGIHTGLIVGNTKVSPKDLSFNHEVFSVYKNNVLAAQGPASEVMGGPLHALRWLAEFLTHKGSGIKKGCLVIPGSPVELVNIESDTELRIEIERVGTVTANFVENKIGPGRKTVD